MKNNPEFPLVWDSSMRDNLVTCPSRALWGNLHHLAPTGVNIHLLFGGAFAKGLEATRKAFYSEGYDLEDSAALGVHAILEYWGDEPPEGVGYKSLPNCILALESYLARFPLDTDILQPYRGVDGTPAIEFNFALPTDVLHPDTSDPILYAGKFDMLGEYAGALWVVDEKTSGRIDGNWSKSWDLRGQFLGYVWAARKYDRPAVGAIVRGTAVYAKEIRHAEVILPISTHLVEDWYEQLCDDLEMAKIYWRRGRWPRAFGTPCTAYAGCPFTILCNKPDPENWIETNFIVNDWSPLK